MDLSTNNQVDMILKLPGASTMRFSRLLLFAVRRSPPHLHTSTPNHPLHFHLTHTYF